MYPQIWQLIGLMRNAPDLAGAMMRGGGPAGGVQQIPQMPGGGVPGMPNPMGVATRPGQGVMGGQPVPAPYGGGGGVPGMPGGGGGVPGPYGGGGGAPGQMTMSLPGQTQAQLGGGAAMAGMNGVPPQSPGVSQTPGQAPPLEEVLAYIRATDPARAGAPGGQEQRFPPSRPDLPDPRSVAPGQEQRFPPMPLPPDRKMPGGPMPKPTAAKGGGVPTSKPRPKGLLGDQQGQNDDLRSWLEKNFWESNRIQGGGGSNR